MVKQVLKLHKFTQESPTSLFPKVIESHSSAQQSLCYYNSSSKLCLSNNYQSRIYCIQVIESHSPAQQSYAITIHLVNCVCQIIINLEFIVFR